MLFFWGLGGVGAVLLVHPLDSCLTFTNVLNLHIPKKVKNKANKYDPIDTAYYKKQRNVVVSLYRQSNMHYLNSISSLNVPKPFWKQCKSYFSNNHTLGDSKIMLIENDKMFSNNVLVDE